MFIFLKGGLQSTLQLNEDRLLEGLMVFALSRIASLQIISHLVQRPEGYFFSLDVFKACFSGKFNDANKWAA
jgi:hypothetical protein